MFIGMKLFLSDQSNSNTLTARLLTAVLMAFLCTLFLFQLNASRAQVKHLEELKLLEEISAALSKELDRSFVSVQVLSVLAFDEQVDDSRFQRLASQLYQDLDGVLSLQLSPNGVVTHLYPDDPSSGIKGRDLLAPGNTQQSALQAIERKRLFIDGPKELQQGGLGIVGRLPIFKDGVFWGFVTTVYRLDDLLAPLKLNRLARTGIDYGIWVDKEAGKPVAIVNSELNLKDNGLNTLAISVANQRWILAIKQQHSSLFEFITVAELVGALVITWLVSSLVASMIQLYFHRRHLNELIAEKTFDLRQRELDLNQAQRIARLGSWSMTPGSPYRTLSPEAQSIFHTTAQQQVIAEYLQDVVDEFRDGVSEFLNADGQGNSSIEYKIVTPEGDVWLKEVVNVEKDMQQLIGTVQDISVEKQNQKLIWQQANIDRLTGLPNLHYSRSLLADQILDLDDKKDSLIFILVDIHQFKKINDGLGINAGDELLVLVAGKLKDSFPDALLLARYAADVFLIVLKKKQHDLNEERIASVINSYFDGPVNLEEASRYLTFHFGISNWPKHDSSVEGLLHCADAALHAAKEQENNNNTCIFHPQLLEDLRLQEELDLDLRIAIREGQLHILYQPVIDCASNDIYAVEALVRWQHPEKGLIPPDNFIPRAESNGLIFSLGRSVVRLVCEDCYKFHLHGLKGLRININVSRNQFLDEGFSQFLNSQLNNHFPAGQKVTFEVTESSELNDYDTLVSVITDVNYKHLQWSLDDFGTGYSSYSAIGLLPIDNIKIDRSFISNMDANSVDQAIVRNIIVMAQTLDKTVTAEGIENQQQLKLLQEMGCNFLQGYYFSKPVSAAEIIETYSKACDD